MYDFLKQLANLNPLFALVGLVIIVVIRSKALQELATEYKFLILIAIVAGAIGLAYYSTRSDDYHFRREAEALSDKYKRGMFYFEELLKKPNLLPKERAAITSLQSDYKFLTDDLNKALKNESINEFSLNEFIGINNSLINKFHQKVPMDIFRKYGMDWMEFIYVEPESQNNLI